MGGEFSLSFCNRPTLIFTRKLYWLLASVILGLLSAVTLFILLRRISGALEYPLSPFALTVLGILIASCAVAIRSGLLAETTQSFVALIIMVLTSLNVITLAWAICLPETFFTGRVLLWLILGIEESWAWGLYVRYVKNVAFTDRQQLLRVDAAHHYTLQPDMPQRFTSQTEGACLNVKVASELSDEVIQQLTRSRTNDGADVLCGLLRAEFAAGQRSVNVHVAFCPAFEVIPTLEIEQIAGPECRIKASQILPYGMRLELKLSTPADEPQTIVLEFSAHSP